MKLLIKPVEIEVSIMIGESQNSKKQKSYEGGGKKRVPTPNPVQRLEPVGFGVGALPGVGAVSGMASAPSQFMWT